MHKIMLLGLMLLPMFSVAAYDGVNTFYNDESEVKALVFLSEKCPCSKSHIKHLNDLVLKHPRVSFYGVISEPFRNDMERAKINDYFTKDRFKLQIISDPSQVLVKKYKALKTPHVTLFSNQKTIYEGGVTNKKSFKDSGKKYLAENLSLLERGQKLKYKKGMSLGCYIRRFE